MTVLVFANESTAARRRVYFHLVDATDGISAETGEAAGQPQISTNGGAWTNTGIGTLSSIGNGRYYADLTQAAVATAGDAVETRYKSAATAECPGDAVRVVAFNPYDAVRIGITSLPDAAADGAGGLPISDAGGLDLDAILVDTNDLQTNQGNWLTATGFATAAALSTHDGKLDTVDGIVDNILIDTNELQTDWANGGRLDLLLDATLADTNELQGDWADGGRLDLIVDAILVDTGTTLPATLATIAGYIDTEVAAIKAVTDVLPDSGALSSIAQASALTTVDTEVGQIKVITDALTAAAAAKLALSAGTIVSGAAAAGTLSTTQMTTNLTEATDDHYNGRIIIWTSGVLQNQATDITDYTGATKLFTFTATTEAPSADDTFIIV